VEWIARYLKLKNNTIFFEIGFQAKNEVGAMTQIAHFEARSVRSVT
jgi:hypothetical protein